MESQIATMKSNLASLKRNGKEKHPKEKKGKCEKPTPPAASTSKSTSKQTKAPPAPKKKGKKPETSFMSIPNAGFYSLVDELYCARIISLRITSYNRLETKRRTHVDDTKEW